MASKKKSSAYKPKKHHGWVVVIFILGTLLPPLAVAARFGIGSDFWLNLLLTIAGYIPGHVHNFYIQNIRNNKTHNRTPKWATRYGLVDDTKLKRNAKRSEWAARYNERDPNGTYEGRDVDEGQVPDEPVRADSASDAPRTQPSALWRAEDEGYYGANGAPGSRSNASLDSSSAGHGRWHYPANFEDTVPEPTRKKSSKKDRWSRAEDARTAPDDGSKRRRKKSSSRRSTIDGPEDAIGGGYGGGSRVDPGVQSNRQDENLNHEF